MTSIPKRPLPPMATRTCEQFYEGPVCCNRNQTIWMKNESPLIDFVESELGACPACTRNLWRLWCGYMCNPYQSLFVNVTAKHIEANNSVWIVDSLNFLVNEQYAEAIYDSCKEGKKQLKKK